MKTFMKVLPPAKVTGNLTLNEFCFLIPMRSSTDIKIIAKNTLPFVKGYKL